MQQRPKQLKNKTVIGILVSRMPILIDFSWTYSHTVTVSLHAVHIIHYNVRLSDWRVLGLPDSVATPMTKKKLYTAQQSVQIILQIIDSDKCTDGVVYDTSRTGFSGDLQIVDSNVTQFRYAAYSYELHLTHTHTHTHTHSENGGIEGYTHKFSGTFHWSVKRTNEDDAGFIFFKLVAE